MEGEAVMTARTFDGGLIHPGKRHRQRQWDALWDHYVECGKNREEIEALIGRERPKRA